jgi:electron transport complex protein RnfA
VPETSILAIILGAVLVENVVLARFLGICPYLGVSRGQETAVGMGMAVLFVMTLATAITWPVQHYILGPDALRQGVDLSYLRTIAFILVIASLVQLVEIVLKKTARTLYRSLGIYLPLITTNCAILGVAILAIQKDLPYVASLVFALASAVGFTCAIVIFAGLRETLDLREIPERLAGAPIALITAAILAMAFMGFAGLGS